MTGLPMLAPSYSDLMMSFLQAVNSDAPVSPSSRGSRGVPVTVYPPDLANAQAIWSRKQG